MPTPLPRRNGFTDRRVCRFSVLSCIGGFCILRIPNIFSACGVWSTFVYRKQEHLAVGSLGQGLTRSRGHPPFRGRLALAFCTLIVSQLGRFVKGFLTFSRNFFSRAPTPVLHSQWQAFVYGYPLPLTMIVYHRPHTKSTGNVAQIRDFSWQLFC